MKFPYEDVDWAGLAPKSQTRVLKVAAPKSDWAEALETLTDVAKTWHGMWMQHKEAAQRRLINSQERAARFASIGLVPPPSLLKALEPEEAEYYRKVADVVAKRKEKPESVMKVDVEIVDEKTKVPHKVTKFFDKQGNFIRQIDHGVAYKTPQRQGMTPAQANVQDRLEAQDAIRLLRELIYDIDAFGRIKGYKPDAENIINDYMRLYAANPYFQRLVIPLLNKVKKQRGAGQAQTETPEERAKRILDME